MNNGLNNPVAPQQDAKASADALHLSRAECRIPELLAPAGDWECARAAVENGADAIYFGLEKFNARMRAQNFTVADLPKLMEFLHRRGVKGYVTFNTLVFADELAEAEQYLRAIISAGVDAAIVQDIGICRLIRRLSSDFPIHASTQMTITSAAGVEFARELGCTLVVLARECSLKEIEKIQAALAQAVPRSSSSLPLPLEVFVHGALCVAYSGQCLTSEALGGRSANRGECAQACRMPYELVSDGKSVPLGDRRYLLSPQDLAGLDVLPDLIRTGVMSLKIEGRLKSPEYVANITRVYRRALDKCRTPDAEGGTAPDPTPRKADPQLMTHDPRYEMEMAFSRGLHTGWFGGINNQQLVHGRFGKKRGVYLGDVTGVQDEKVFVELRAPLKPGDGVVFDAGHPESREEGGRVYEIKVGEPFRVPVPALKKAKTQSLAAGELPPTKAGEPLALPCRAELRFGHGDVDFWRIHVGDKVWKTSDQDLDRRLRATFEGDQPKFQRPIRMQVSGRNGQPLVLIVRDEIGHVVQVTSELPLAKADKQPLTMERLREQLGRLGGTAFKLGQLKNLLEPGVMLPVSELNRLRRNAVSRLDFLRAQPKRWTLNVPPASFLPDGGFVSGSTPETSQLVVLVRNLAQLEAAVRCGVRTLYCEFEDTKRYREAVALFKAADGRDASASTRNSQPATIWVAPPRIFKTGEEWILNQVRASDADGYLVRNHDHLKFFDGCRCVGDFSLNVANSLTADYFIKQRGLERVTASYDLNIAQLEALLQSAPPEWFEITIHQHMPMFHMEHCVFCAFLSKGTDFTNCGRPCDRHDVQLRDRVGALHPLKADAGCRNTVFNALAQTGAEFVSRMLARGARRFRIEFLNETPGQVEQTIGMYRQLLSGEIEGTQLWRELKLLNQLGVTRGQMR